MIDTNFIDVVSGAPVNPPKVIRPGTTAALPVPIEGILPTVDEFLGEFQLRLSL